MGPQGAVPVHSAYQPALRLILAQGWHPTGEIFTDDERRGFACWGQGILHTATLACPEGAPLGRG